MNIVKREQTMDTNEQRKQSASKKTPHSIVMAGEIFAP